MNCFTSQHKNALQTITASIYHRSFVIVNQSGFISPNQLMYRYMYRLTSNSYTKYCIRICAN